MKKTIELYVFDLDGTLADDTHRLHHICDENGSPKDNKDWDSFFKACVDDKPIENTISVLRSISLKRHCLGEDVQILVLTGRSDIVQNETAVWLWDKTNFMLKGETIYPIDMLVMRPSQSREDDHKLKPKQLMHVIESLEKAHQKKVRVVGIFEDRNRVVNAWRKLGYQTYQVSDGNF